MKRSYVISLAGISAALAYVSIILSFYVEVMSISFGVLAGICVMLPLTVKSLSGAIFAYVSAGILSAVTVEPVTAMTFILFFGPFTIVGYAVDQMLMPKLRLAKWLKYLIGYAIKGIFYSASITSLYFIMNMFGALDELFTGAIMWVGIALLIVVFFLYDIVMRLVFVNLRYVINHRILKNRGVENKRDSKTEKKAVEDTKVDDDVFGIDAKDESNGDILTQDKSDDSSDEMLDNKAHETNDDTSSPKPADEKTQEDESSRRFKHFLESEDDEDKED